MMDPNTKILIKKSIELFNQDFRHNINSNHIEIAHIQNKVSDIYQLCKAIYLKSTLEQEPEILELSELVINLLTDIENTRMEKSIIKVHINTSVFHLN